MLRFCDVGREGFDGPGEVANGLTESLRGRLSLAYRRRGSPREYPDVADREVQLVGRRSVEPELSERPPARRRELDGIVAGVERLPESAHASVHLTRLLQGALGPAEVALSQGRRGLFEGVDEVIEDRMRGPLYDAGDWDASLELGFELIATDGVRELSIEETIARIRERVVEAKVHVSFDVDFVDPAFAPGTGTPEIGGFTSREAQEFVRGLSEINIVGFDVVEVYPQYDPAQITTLLAANVAHEFLSLIALLKKGGRPMASIKL
jgi:hypothetical protein